MTTISFIGLLVCALPLGYLCLLALASVRMASPQPICKRHPSICFIIVIPAHDEASVIETTVQQLRTLDYPTELISIHGFEVAAEAVAPFRGVVTTIGCPSPTADSFDHDIASRGEPYATMARCDL